MVKKRAQKLKKRRSAATQVSNSGNETDSALANSAKQSGPAAPKHVQRKVARQSKFLDSIIDTHQKVLSAKASKLKKKGKRKTLSAALGDLSSLLGALQDAAGSDGVSAQKRANPKGLGVGGCKKRTRICDKETERLQQVLAHPQFKSNPIAAVTAHLAATLPPEPAPPRAQPSQDNPASKRRQKLLRQRHELMQTD